MDHLKYLRTVLFCTMSAVSGLSFAQNGMTLLTDEELSAQDGQALLNLSYLAPNDATNNASNNSTGQNIGFYKLGIEGKVEINANIRKLQLGCGGVNGANGCDIEIDNFSLSGDPGALTGPVVGGVPTATLADSAARVATDAVMTNPFFNIAIKNPGSASTREIVGIQLGAQSMLGLLTLGQENTTTPNGINSLSGYMNIGSATGVANTESRTMNKSSTGKDMTGRISIGLFSPGGVPVNFTASTYDLVLQPASATVTTVPTVVSGNRMTSVNLLGSATIAPIFFAGTMTATVIGIDLDKRVTGSISNLTATVPITQSLGFIHKLPINGNPFSMSLQGQNIHWPGAAAAAQRGWWMAFEDQINIGNISPATAVPVTNAVLSQALGPEGCSNGATPGINCALYANPPACAAFGSPSCLGGDLPVGNVNIAGTNVIFPLSNLQLSAQSFAPNCYGGLKFC